MKVAPVRGEALCNTDKKEKLEDRIGMVKMKEEKKKQETNIAIYQWKWEVKLEVNRKRERKQLSRILES